MKKINIYILSLLLIGAFSLSSCEQLLDVNEDPVNPTEVTEELLLTGIQSNFSFQVIGGIPARMAAGLTQQTVYPVNQSYDDYFITENDIDGFWNDFSYVGVMANCKILSEQAAAKNKNYHAAIAKIIWAQNMAMITDAFGDAPFTQAWQPEQFPFPAYDTQEEIFVSIHNLLDEAIAHIDNTNQSAEVPGVDDLIYGGDMQKWRKYAFGLKARYYMRLSSAPGYNAQTQSQLVLDALSQSFTSNDDNAFYQYSSQLLQENPWNQYAVNDRWNTFTAPNVSYISSLQQINKRDIRLALHVRKSDPTRDGFELITNTDGSVNLYLKPEPYNNQSFLGVLYADPDSPLPWLMYSEIKFLEAEANYHLGNTAAQTQAFREALEADFSFIRPYLNKISKTANDEAALSNTAALNDMIETYISTIVERDDYTTLMTQKNIVNFLSFEAYNDLRRANLSYNFRSGSVLKDRFDYDGIALRFPYPNSEWQYNPRNVATRNIPLGFSSMLIPVWWDSAE
ncbi:SusD/RagB family nutrient-binding outer membrane lipoprotein [Bernardetia sp. OM2101]|uniref:SusD/RagB family nutrient-binding outer membrane lipoprotein n=1 Tax=Bernardetia sp. OM2101 TaxID=3344876 RepID=UPI0035CF335C